MNKKKWWKNLVLKNLWKKILLLYYCYFCYYIAVSYLKCALWFSESIRSLNKDVEPLQKEMFAVEDCIKTKCVTIRYEMSTHNKIISDIRELFKTMIKVCCLHLIFLPQCCSYMSVAFDPVQNSPQGRFFFRLGCHSSLKDICNSRRCSSV